MTDNNSDSIGARSFTIERGVHRRYAVFIREGDQLTDIIEGDKGFIQPFVNRLLRKGAAQTKSEG